MSAPGIDLFAQTPQQGQQALGTDVLGFLGGLATAAAQTVAIFEADPATTGDQVIQQATADQTAVQGQTFSLTNPPQWLWWAGGGLLVIVLALLIKR